MHERPPSCALEKTREPKKGHASQWRENRSRNALRHPSVREKEERQAERQTVTANGGGGGGRTGALGGVHKLKNSM